ncbi:MAG: 2'-5' RNA ligase family protein [Tardiphaga sp.]
MDEPTYILTAELDPASFAWLDGLRQRHFPPARNFLSAHLTMFHRLSALQTERLVTFAFPQPIELQFDAPMFLGAGVAYRVTSPALAQLRADIKHHMAGHLSRQDAQTWRPHVTVQNKVAADIARELHRQLTLDFDQRAGRVTGLLVWEYLGGPWRLSRRYGLG